MKKQLKISHEGKKFRVNQPSTLEELKQLIYEKTKQNEFKVTYRDKANDDIDLLDESDYQSAIMYFHDNEFEVRVKTFKLSSIYTMKDLANDFKFFKAFFPQGQIKCCRLATCELCKGREIITPTEEQKGRIDEILSKQLQSKFGALQIYYQENWNINIKTIDDLLHHHVRLDKEGKIIKKQPLVKVPELSSNNSPSNQVHVNQISSQAITPQDSQMRTGQFFSTQRPSMIVQQKASQIQKSDMLKSQGKSQIEGSQSQILSQQDYKAFFSELKINPDFEPNAHSSFTVNIKNNGLKDWPKFVLVKLVGNNEINGFQTIRSLRASEEATFKIFFLAPPSVAKYSQNWRLCYQDQENGPQTWFGPRLTVDFEVKQNPQKEQGLKADLVNKINDVFGGNKRAIEKYVDQLFQTQKFFSIDDSIFEISELLKNNDKFLT